MQEISLGSFVWPSSRSAVEPYANRGRKSKPVTAVRFSLTMQQANIQNQLHAAKSGSTYFPDMLSAISKSFFAWTRNLVTIGKLNGYRCSSHLSTRYNY